MLKLNDLLVDECAVCEFPVCENEYIGYEAPIVLDGFAPDLNPTFQDVIDEVVEFDVFDEPTSDCDKFSYKVDYELSGKKGIKYCLKNKNELCFEQCYSDDNFCETVVYLGYPEEKIKYPNAYPLNLYLDFSR